MAVVVARREGGDVAAVGGSIASRGLASPGAREDVGSPGGRRRPPSGAGEASITVLPLSVRGDQDQTADLAVDLRDELGSESRAPGSEPYFVGQQALWAGMQDLTKEDLESAERIGFPIVLVILLAVFGSLAAALPLALGFVSVAMTGAAIFFLSQAHADVGLRDEHRLDDRDRGGGGLLAVRARPLPRGGARRRRAGRGARRGAAHLGLAVAFSGVTVMLSLAGLYLVDSTTIRSMAMGAIIVVAVSILAAVTLLPVLMRLLGRRVYARGRIAARSRTTALVAQRRRRGGSTPPRRRAGFWERWTRG